MTKAEKAAYIRGLADGAALRADTPESRLLAAVSDAVCDLLKDTAALEEGLAARETEKPELAALQQRIEALEKAAEPEAAEEPDLSAAGDDFPDTNEVRDEDITFPFSGTLYDIECPSCGMAITIDEEMLAAGSMKCPRCEELLEFDLEDE